MKIFCVGRTAFVHRVSDDLHVWISRDRRVVLIQSDRDNWRLWGQRGGWVVPYDMTPEQQEYIKVFEMKIITRAVARDMLEKDRTV